MKPGRRFSALLKNLDYCETADQMFDADNERYIRDNVLGRQITVTSVRKMPSDYHNGVYVVIGFTGPDGKGQFSIGGNGARYPLVLSRFDHLPATMVLHTADTSHGPIYKWKRLGQ